MHKTTHNRTENPRSAAWWTPQREAALALVMEDRLIDEEIARRVGVCRRTLAYWKVHPLFAAEWDRLSAEYAEQSLQDAVRRAVAAVSR